MMHNISSNDASRDRPLGFHWNAPELAQELGLPRAANAAMAATRAAILAEAVLGAECEQSVSYSRNKSFYARARRYRGTAYTYTTLLASIAELDRRGLITDCRVPPGHLGWQSSFTATPTLIDGWQNSSRRLGYALGETIWLRDSKKQLVDYIDTQATRLMRRQMAEINEALAALDIDVPAAQPYGQHLRIGGTYVLPQPGNGMRRIFNRNSFALHGRLYGWWQCVPHTARLSMTVNGEQLAEVDFTAMHAAIIYSQAGIKLECDPYTIDGFQRDEVKHGFNIALNARSQAGAVAALAKDHLDGDLCRAAEIIAAVKQRHKPIAFCSDVGIKLMRKDSEIILRAQQSMNRRGIASLPIHDALIVPSQSADLASESMIKAFTEVIGSDLNCKVKSSTNSPSLKEGGGRQDSTAENGKAEREETGRERNPILPICKSHTAFM
jgi:hypothetical protein